MANTDGAIGFRPISKDGSPYNGGTQRCSIIATDTTAVFIGDAVVLDGSSNGGYPGVTQAAAGAGNGVYGVVTAFEASPATSLDDQYRKASTLRYCQVASAIDTDFEAQDDGTLTAASSGLNADLTVGSGSTTYGVSAMEIDATTEATTSTLDLQLVRPVDRADNDASSANSKWIVRFNTPRTAQSGLGSVGV
jgi:hypothetical protein